MQTQISDCVPIAGISLPGCARTLALVHPTKAFSVKAPARSEITLHNSDHLVHASK
jgi:hypothetical protein